MLRLPSATKATTAAASRRYPARRKTNRIRENISNYPKPSLLVETSPISKTIGNEKVPGSGAAELHTLPLPDRGERNVTQCAVHAQSGRIKSFVIGMRAGVDRTQSTGWMLRLKKRLTGPCASAFRQYIARLASGVCRRRRTGGRVAEGARLERVYTGNRIEGSNPSLSAIF